MRACQLYFNIDLFKARNKPYGFFGEENLTRSSIPHDITNKLRLRHLWLKYVTLN